MVKMSVPTDFHGLSGIFYDIVLSFRHLPGNNARGAIFDHLPYVSIHVDPTDGLMCQQSCHLCAHVIKCSCFSALSCSASGIIFLMPFIAMPSMIAVSSPNDQYCCSSFCTSALVDGQPLRVISNSMPMCLSSSVSILIFSPVMQSDMSMHDYCIDVNTHAWNLFISICLMVLSG